MANVKVYLSQEKLDLIGANIPEGMTLEEFCSVLLADGLSRLEHEQQHKENTVRRLCIWGRDDGKA